MKSTEAPSLLRLRELLRDTDGSPAELAQALAAARDDLTVDPALTYDLCAHERRWLERQHARGPLPAELLGLRRDVLVMRARSLIAGGPGPGRLFDLAEAAAMAAAVGEHGLARDCELAAAASVSCLAPGEELDREATERFALLAAAIEDLPIAHQVDLLHRSSRTMLAAAAATGSKVCRRLGRRLGRAADDRELARRLERRLGVRGVTAVETANFVLLLVVLGTLIVQSTVELSPAQSHALHWVDALACTFFIADFLFELWLHPARWSWFARNALTDLMPAIPAALFLLPGVDAVAAADQLLLLRTLRLFRVTWAARYVQALRPLLRALRLLLFLVRGLDGLTARFAHLLNREFVFAPAAAAARRPRAQMDERDLLFAALRREHELLELLPQAERHQQLPPRIAAVRRALERLPAVAAVPRRELHTSREVPIGEAIEFLWSLRPQDVGRWLGKTDIGALDRVVRVLSAVPVRWLPIVRRFAVHPLPAAAEQRVVALARRIAVWLEAWHRRLLFFADLHGIVTGPQVLDRVATALVRATQRPAIRLLLFGGLFSLPRAFGVGFGATVSTSLLVLGGICLVLLMFGHWLKRLAGQASEAYRMTSEAHFISQLERVKARHEGADIAFLARRVFGDAHRAAHARRLIAAQLGSARTGVPVADGEAPHELCLDANRIALLYVHFRDGAPLHQSDVKTTEQLLANQSIDNLRTRLLRCDARERKRLRKLKLDDGSVFHGPYLWFRFITESIAVETAKRITGYNRFCIPAAERATASPAALAAMADWLARRRDPRGGRTPKERRVASPGWHPSTEFTALDFLGGDPERDRHLAAVFGKDVLDVVRFDRRTMVREIFGTRPARNLPSYERCFNPLRFYERRLSHGRVLLAPLLLALRSVRFLAWIGAKMWQIVREVLDPELAMRRREVGEAPFAVALRKIQRMKAPGLLEAIRLRLALDPVYAGAPAGWTAAEPFATEPELERDLRFLLLPEREAAPLREAAAGVRRNIEALHALVAELPPLAAAQAPEQRAAGELAVSCAWIVDLDRVRALAAAKVWEREVLPAIVAGRRPGWFSRICDAVRRSFAVHPVEVWCRRHRHELPPPARLLLRRAYAANRAGTRDVVDAWLALPGGSSTEAAVADILRAAHRLGPAIRRDLLALRAVQSLAVLDIYNYRDLVYRIGDYETDGEAALGVELP